MQQLDAIRPDKVIQYLSRRLSSVLLAFEVIVSLAVAFVFLKALPRRIVTPLYGQFETETPVKIDEVSRERAKRIRHLIHRAKSFIPWESTCLMDALAAKWMLNRRHISNTMYIGFKSGKLSEETPIEGHAWLRSGNVIVTGKSGYRDYKTFTFYGNNHG